MVGITREEKTGPEKGIERLGREMEKERRLHTETEMRGPGKAMAPGLEMKGMNTVEARYREKIGIGMIEGVREMTDTEGELTSMGESVSRGGGEVVPSLTPAKRGGVNQRSRLKGGSLVPLVTSIIIVSSVSPTLQYKLSIFQK